jgi:large subunit ribosomal protein L8e
LPPKECTLVNSFTVVKKVNSISKFHLLIFKIAGLTVGNVLPLSAMPEGTIICNVEGKPTDRGEYARASGNYATIISHDTDANKARIRLPSGAKKTISGN